MYKAMIAAVGLLVAFPVQAKPVQAAMPESGSGCYVGDANELYFYDIACAYHAVSKVDANGHLLSFTYQDKGQLQTGQVAPKRAIHRDVILTLDGLACSGDEVVTPSGQYSSNLRCG
ncbi:MAG: hypothetical protein V4444_07545 [Pseudomonadota bacterium]